MTDPMLSWLMLVNDLERERAELRAEVKRLRTSDEAWKVQLEREAARNERLQAQLRHHHGGTAGCAVCGWR